VINYFNSSKKSAVTVNTVHYYKYQRDANHQTCVWTSDKFAGTLHISGPAPLQ